jgi:RNA polymerase sporulation-specific sigma factor
MFENAFFELIKDILCIAGYLNSPIVFPKALSAEEESKYIQMLKDGDASARDVLIERNLRLVAHIAKKYSGKNVDTDDLISVGTIGLIKGINTFDFDKCSHIATYAARCIENEMLMYLRANKRVNSEVSLNDPIGHDKEGNNISLMDVLYSTDSSVADQVQTNIEVEKLYAEIGNVLSPREMTVIELRYGLYGKERLTQRETADFLNISRSYVSRIEKKAVSKLAKIFQKNR